MSDPWTQPDAPPPPGPPTDPAWATPPGPSAEPVAGWPAAPSATQPTTQTGQLPAGRPTPYVGAAHRPGAIPLRPLGLNDMYDAAFRIIRFNPRATVGAAVLVAVVSMALPLVVTVALSATADLTLDASGDDPFGGADLTSLIGAFGAFLVGGVLNSVGGLLVTGLIVRVCMAAAVGRRLTLGQAWAETRGTRWRLIGLSALVLVVSTLFLGVYVLAWVLVVVYTSVVVIVVWGVVSVPLVIASSVWVWVRVVHLAVPALVCERIGVFAALGRSRSLTRRQFWRVFGIALLTVIVASVASQVLTTPISFVLSFGVGLLGPQYALLGLALSQAVTTVIAAAFVTPFTGAVTSLQYVDQRMRKEAFDVELMRQAGVTAT